MIESVEDINTETKKFKCKCEKSGKLFERIKKKEFNEIEVKLSNTETAFCNKEIENFKKWMGDRGYLKTDCWCKHIEGFKNAD